MQGDCGLLVSVIRTLDLSETDEQREREKLKIEKEFKKSDQRLNEVSEPSSVENYKRLNDISYP